MKSYAQATDSNVINWTEVLALPEDQIVTSFHVTAADSWRTCPCGQLANILPRRNAQYAGTPEDEVLATLGRQFTENFKNAKYDECRNLLQLINLRGDFLTETIAKEIKEEITKLQAQLAELE